MRAKLEVDVQKILNNLNIIKGDKEACVAVKGNAYGAGLEMIDYFYKNGEKFFGVSTLDEALYIRQKYEDAKILIFSAIFPDELEITRTNNIMITVYDYEMLNLMTDKDKFHLKFDIGMGRLGFNKSESENVLNYLIVKDLKLTGIYTHLPKVDDDDVTLKEINDFEGIVNQFKEKIEIDYIHIHSSLAALKFKTTFDNLVRPGLLMYGYYATLEQKEKYNEVFKLQESMELSAQVTHIKEYQGEIGYDLTDIVEGEIATVAIGYHDGFDRRFQHAKLTNIGEIVGRVCMCQIMVALDQNSDIKKGQFLQLFGAETSIYNLTEHAGMITYELLSCLTERITRIYK